jgi:hypothetical protein
LLPQAKLAEEETLMNDREYVERTTVSDTPRGRETVRESMPAPVKTGAAGWWIAAIVAIVAVAGLIVLFGAQDRQSELQAARNQGAAQASLDAATADTQRAAAQASQAAQSAVGSTARASQHAADAAQSAAAQTAQAAQSAGDSARDAAATEPAPAPQQ